MAHFFLKKPHNLAHRGLQTIDNRLDFQLKKWLNKLDKCAFAWNTCKGSYI